jgi:hypothetical protein
MKPAKASFLFLTTVWVWAIATPATAQVGARDIGVYFDENGTLCTVNAPPFVNTHEFWVLGFDLDGGVLGYELGLNIDPRIVVFSSLMDQPGTPINIGQPPSNWIVGTGACFDGEGIFSLLKFVWGYYDAAAVNMQICLGPSTPSSFVPVSPGYLQCDDSLVPFGLAHYPGDYAEGCSVVNPTGTLLCEPPVATETSSWGAVKANFHD